MTHRFPVKEIARQSGLGTTTIDRVLHKRPNVSPQTRQRVMVAIAELERQEAQMAAQGRRMFFDVVIEAPSRFSKEVKRAAEHALPQIKTAVCRTRFVLQEIMSDDEVVDTLHRIAKRGSHGVCLKARNVPKIRQAIDALSQAGIPVVTLVTDIPDSKRLSYVGLDNRRAGQIAAYLIGQALKDKTGTLLITKSQIDFLGEEERSDAFCEAIMQSCPTLNVVDASGGHGTLHGTSKTVQSVIDQLTELVGVYSMGGANNAIFQLLEQHKLCPQIFVAHDNNDENLSLLKELKINFILEHNLQQDINSVYDILMAYQGLGTQNLSSQASPIGVLTPLS